MVRNIVVWCSNIHLSAWQRLKQIAPKLISPKQIVPKRICQAAVFFPDCKLLDSYVNGGLQDYAWWDSEACRQLQGMVSIEQIAETERFLSQRERQIIKPNSNKEMF
jgi:hypothetical protein